jgi:hydroxyacylglutathione hydrolase
MLFERIESPGLAHYSYLLGEGSTALVIDPRRDAEREASGRIRGAHGLALSELPGRMEEVPRDGRVAIFCGSGRRSMTAASLLKRAGYGNLLVALGGIKGWISTTCPAG